MAQSPDLDVQALALATLHLGKGSDPAVRRFLKRQVRALGERDGLVRDRWAWVLMVRGDDYLSTNDYRSALAAYERAAELKADDPALLRRMGVAHTRLRDLATAIDLLRRSLALREDARVRVELGFALMQQGDLDGAEREYRQAVALNPHDAGGYANLAIVQLRRENVAAAIESVRHSLEIDPGLADGYFLLARAFGSLGQRDSAEAAVRRGLEFDPQSALGRSMLEALERSPRR